MDGIISGVNTKSGRQNGQFVSKLAQFSKTKTAKRLEKTFDDDPYN